jgi:hypothetical protein
MPLAKFLVPALLKSANDTLSDEDIASMLAEAEALDAYFARRGRSGDLLQALKTICVAIKNDRAMSERDDG